jgi:hypothetical protein
VSVPDAPEDGAAPAAEATAQVETSGARAMPRLRLPGRRGPSPPQ